ncbi:MAG: hypothetical protein KOO60_06790 [Gemmatimonadales bacterium]|nr:hypothetical protein [Gemmatimonadales bacterium]
MAKRAWVVLSGNAVGSAVLRDGFIVGSDHYTRGWVCIDVVTGKILHRSKAKLQYGSAVFADGCYYGVCSDGVVLLMKVDKESFKEISRFKLVEGKKDVWATPVICDGKLYLRYHDKLYCYDISGKKEKKE